MPPAQSEAQVAEEVARMKEAGPQQRKRRSIQILLLGHRPHDPLLHRLRGFGHRIRPQGGGVQRTVSRNILNVASICIYPSFVETVGLAVDGTPMRITSVAGGFPASQTFLEVKALEVGHGDRERRRRGWTSCLNVGRMLTGEYDEAANEVGRSSAPKRTPKSY